MVIKTNTELYYTIRRNFQGGDAWANDFSQQFAELLKEHKASINQSARLRSSTYVCDHVGISPGVDVIEFQDEKLYTMFILRWA